MWSCPHCGQQAGLPFQDDQLQGMLCLNPDCGRFDASEGIEDHLTNAEYTDM